MMKSLSRNRKWLGNKTYVCTKNAITNVDNQFRMTEVKYWEDETECECVRFPASNMSVVNIISGQMRLYKI